jgi:hypothetical protein
LEVDLPKRRRDSTNGVRLHRFWKFVAVFVCKEKAPPEGRAFEDFHESMEKNKDNSMLSVVLLPTLDRGLPGLGRVKW